MPGKSNSKVQPNAHNTAAHNTAYCTVEAASERPRLSGRALGLGPRFLRPTPWQKDTNPNTALSEQTPFTHAQQRHNPPSYCASTASTATLGILLHHANQSITATLQLCGQQQLGEGGLVRRGEAQGAVVGWLVWTNLSLSVTSCTSRIGTAMRCALPRASAPTRHTQAGASCRSRTGPRPC